MSGEQQQHGERSTPLAMTMKPQGGGGRKTRPVSSGGSGLSLSTLPTGRTRGGLYKEGMRSPRSGGGHFFSSGGGSGCGGSGGGGSGGGHGVPLSPVGALTPVQGPIADFSDIDLGAAALSSPHGGASPVCIVSAICLWVYDAFLSGVCVRFRSVVWWWRWGAVSPVGALSPVEGPSADFPRLLSGQLHCLHPTAHPRRLFRVGFCRFPSGACVCLEATCSFCSVF